LLRFQPRRKSSPKSTQPARRSIPPPPAARSRDGLAGAIGLVERATARGAKRLLRVSRDGTARLADVKRARDTGKRTRLRLDEAKPLSSAVRSRLA